MNISKHSLTGGVVAGLLFLGVTSFAAGSRLPQRAAGPVTVLASQAGDDHGRDGQGNNGGQQVRVRIELTGVVINGRRSEGHAEFRMEPGRTGLRVEAENVNLPDGTRLLVQANGAAVGMLTLAGGHAELELNSQDGDRVPMIAKGSIVRVLAVNGALTFTVLSGQF